MCNKRFARRCLDQYRKLAVGKVARAMRAAVSAAVMTGDGIGKPLGILNPAAGIPVCETSEHTPTDRFSWQDLVGLRFEVPVQYGDANCAYLCNQRAASFDDDERRGRMADHASKCGRSIAIHLVRHAAAHCQSNARLPARNNLYRLRELAAGL